MTFVIGHCFFLHAYKILPLIYNKTLFYFRNLVQCNLF
jgi:hypothetical protein